ncbi:MAG: acyl-CoA dehydrogenase family protein, partial [Bryobacteraceae bacterium]
MEFAYSPKVEGLRKRVQSFLDTHVVPNVSQWEYEVAKGIHPPSVLEPLKAKARAEGLWNLFLPNLPKDAPGMGLPVLEYAPLAEIMGRVFWAPEVFNCNAPDTGNMELLHIAATPAQREQYLVPLFAGSIRSAFSMTEPDVGSSDPTNIATRIEKQGGAYVINGRKWFVSNGADPRCKFMILMGITDPKADRHSRHSMIIVPMDTPGVTIVRQIPILNHATGDLIAEIVLKDVSVPAENLLGQEGHGFALAQARLGPGRIHHCMRSIGQCELALELMAERAMERVTFGKPLADRDNVREWIAQSRLEIDQARLLVMRAAWIIDNQGNKAARTDVSAIKIVTARMHVNIFDRAIQVFGAAGLTPDTPLANLFTWGRALRFI